MTTFLLIVLGIILGWFNPVHKIGDPEDKWIGPSKEKVPDHLRWW